MSITLQERTEELATALVLHRDDVERQKGVLRDANGRIPESARDMIDWSDSLQCAAKMLLVGRVPLAWVRRYFEVEATRHVQVAAQHNHGRYVPEDGFSYEVVKTYYRLADAIYRYCVEYLNSVPGYSEMEYEHQCYSF